MNIQASTTLILAVLSLALASSSKSSSSSEEITSVDGIAKQVQGLQLSESVDNQAISIQDADSQSTGIQEVDNQETKSQGGNIQEAKSQETKDQKSKTQEVKSREAKTQNSSDQETKTSNTSSQDTGSCGDTNSSSSSSSSSGSKTPNITKSEDEVAPLLRALEKLNVNDTAAQSDSDSTGERTGGKSQDDSDSENSSSDSTYTPKKVYKEKSSSGSHTTKSSEEDDSSPETSTESKDKSPSGNEDKTRGIKGKPSYDYQGNGSKSDDESSDGSYDGRRREFVDSQDSTEENDSAGTKTTQDHPNSQKGSGTLGTKNDTVIRWQNLLPASTETTSNTDLTEQKSKDSGEQSDEANGNGNEENIKDDSSPENPQSETTSKTSSLTSESDVPSSTQTKADHQQRSVISPKQTRKVKTDDLVLSTALVAGTIVAICYFCDPEGTVSTYQQLSADTWEGLVRAQDACTAAGGYLVQQVGEHGANLIQTALEGVGAVSPDYDANVCYRWEAPPQQNSTHPNEAEMPSTRENFIDLPNLELSTIWWLISGGATFPMLLSRSLLCILVSAVGCSKTRFTTRVVSLAELCVGTEATKEVGTVLDYDSSKAQDLTIGDVALLDDGAQSIPREQAALKVKRSNKQKSKSSGSSESSTSAVKNAELVHSLEDGGNEEYLSGKVQSGGEYSLKYGDEECYLGEDWVSGEQSSSEARDNEEQSLSSGILDSEAINVQAGTLGATHGYNLHPRIPKSTDDEKMKRSCSKSGTESCMNIGKAAKSTMKNGLRLCTTVPYNAMGKLANYVKSTRTGTKVGAALIVGGCVCYATGAGESVMDSEIFRTATGRVCDYIGSLACGPNCAL